MLCFPSMILTPAQLQPELAIEGLPAASLRTPDISTFRAHNDFYNSIGQEQNCMSNSTLIRKTGYDQLRTLETAGEPQDPQSQIVPKRQGRP